MNRASGQIDPAMIRAAIHQAHDSASQIDDLRAANARTISTLETALKHAVEQPFKAPSIVPDGAAEHRRALRAGVPSRIASDPELEAFIRARIGHLTFAQILSEVAASFPPKRRTSMSALSRWWKINRPPLPGSD